MSKLDDLKKGYDNVDEIKKHIEDVTREPPKVAPPVIREDTRFTDEDTKKLVDKTLLNYKNKKIRLRRREKKMIKNLEYDSIKSTQGTVIGLAIVGLVFILLLREFLPNEAMYIIIIMVGSMMFIPVGMIMGWVLLDPIMRCKILRKVSKTNYGIVNFVGKGKRMVSKIKNFNHGLIWQKEECWILTKDKIFQLTKDGNAANDGYRLDPDSVLTLVDTVPVIFVDMDSMEPLSIMQSGRVPVYPSEIGASCKAWMDVQRAKQLSHKKTLDIFMLVAIICCVGAIAISFLTMNKIDELTKMVSNLQDRLASLTP